MVKIIKTRAKKIFTPTKIPGAKWVANQYVGCEHACKYCYAKFVCKWKKYGEWGRWVEVKENASQLTRHFVKGKVYMSSLSDAYQPLEEKLLLTKNVLQSMDKRVELSILTKSDLVLRDIELFKRFRTIEIGLTINGFDGRLKKDLEPFFPHHESRIYALKVLNEEKIPNYGFISPTIPGIVDVESLVEETKDFVDKYWIEFLNLRASGKDFRNWLIDNFPESYSIMSDYEKLNAFVSGVIEGLKRLDVRVEGVVLHLKKWEIRRL
ncbi:radical SAM protein [Archaeoglobales archaeon]|nr:MAG: radical SAM protein [Archaeoglobales archaeon]